MVLTRPRIILSLKWNPSLCLLPSRLLSLIFSSRVNLFFFFPLPSPEEQFLLETELENSLCVLFAVSFVENISLFPSFFFFKIGNFVVVYEKIYETSAKERDKISYTRTAKFINYSEEWLSLDIYRERFHTHTDLLKEMDR